MRDNNVIKLWKILFEEQSPDLVAVPEKDISSWKQAKPKVEKDETLQDIIDNMSSVIQENKFKMSKFLFCENNISNRVVAGSAGQEIVGEKIVEILKKKSPDKNFTYIPSRQGSGETDLKIFEVDENNNIKNPVTTIEVKSVASFNDPVYFFDKTVTKKNPITNKTLVNLVKSLYNLNQANMVVVDLNDPSKPIPLESLDQVDNLYHLFRVAKRKTNTSPENFKDCVEFSGLPVELTSLLQNEKLPYTLPLSQTSGITVYCSHEFFGSKELDPKSKELYFHSRGNDKEDDVIYLQREDNGEQIYSYLRSQQVNKKPVKYDGDLIQARKKVVTLSREGKNKELPRKVGTPGNMYKDCFYANFDVKETKTGVENKVSTQNPEIRKLVFDAIKEKYSNDDYLAITDGINLKIVGLKDNLQYLEVDGVLEEHHLRSVQLRPPGTTEIGGIRVKIECTIDYNGFTTLPLLQHIPSVPIPELPDESHLH
jgi:hypothetical protein